MPVTDSSFKSFSMSFLKVLETQSYPDNTDAKLKEHLIKLVGAMLSNDSYWEIRCPISVRSATTFVSDMNRFVSAKAIGDLKWVYAKIFHFLVEDNFYNAADLGTDNRLAYEFASGKKDYFDKEQWQFIQSCLQELPIAIMKRLMHSGRESNIIEFRRFLDSVCEQHQEWEQKFGSFQERVKQVERDLAGTEDAKNFVRLNKAFKMMHKKKEKEMCWTRWRMRLMGFAALAPLLFNANHLWGKFANDPANAQKFVSADAVLTVVSFSLFAVLMYYFRIVLHDYKSVASQLLQLDLRMALVQFVQKYSEYAASVKSEKTPELLARFESVIFSNIVPDGSQIPAVHDGVEELAKLIVAVKKG